VAGTPTSRSPQATETVSVSLYRVAQEALTNIRRHSTARTGQVMLRYLASGNGSVREVLGLIARGADRHRDRRPAVRRRGHREDACVPGAAQARRPRPVQAVVFAYKCGLVVPGDDPPAD
jgi:hypothetical protein